MYLLWNKMVGGTKEMRWNVTFFSFNEGIAGWVSKAVNAPEIQGGNQPLKNMTHGTKLRYSRSTINTPWPLGLKEKERPFGCFT